MDWKPIETAPRDGTAILVCTAMAVNPGKRIAVAMWSSFGDWCTTEPIWGDPLNEPPSHWQPLPEPPLIEEGEEEAGETRGKPAFVGEG